MVRRESAGARGLLSNIKDGQQKTADITFASKHLRSISVNIYWSLIPSGRKKQKKDLYWHPLISGKLSSDLILTYVQ